MKITLTKGQILDMYAAALRDRKFVALKLIEAYKNGTNEISVDAHDIKELKQLAWTEYLYALYIKSELSVQYMDIYKYLKSKEEEEKSKLTA